MDLNFSLELQIKNDIFLSESDAFCITSFVDV